MSAPAVFIDRDGTLVHARHYPTRPDELVLYDGVALELQRLQALGMRVVIITNQAGIARGYLTEQDLAPMHAYLVDELARRGVQVNGVYYCPHHPDGVVATLAVPCACRKPAPGMLVRAAAELGLDLARSWFLGDILDDVEAGGRAGCRTVLVDLGTESLPTAATRRPTFVARDTVHALRIVRAVAFGDGAAELNYRPARWAPAGKTATLAASALAMGDR